MLIISVSEAYVDPLLQFLIYIALFFCVYLVTFDCNCSLTLKII